MKIIKGKTKNIFPPIFTSAGELPATLHFEKTISIVLRIDKNGQWHVKRKKIKHRSGTVR